MLNPHIKLIIITVFSDCSQNINNNNKIYDGNYYGMNYMSMCCVLFVYFKWLSCIIVVINFQDN